MQHTQEQETTTLRHALEGDRTVHFEEFTIHYGSNVGDYAIVPHTAIGYGAGPLEQSNRESVESAMDLYEASPGFYVEKSGEGLFALDLEQPYEVVAAAVDIIRALNDYPALNEERLCELEYEATQEAWNDYGRDDLVRAMTSLQVEEDELDLSEIEDHVIDAAYDKWCATHCDGGSVVESGGSVYFYDLEEAAEHVLSSLYYATLTDNP
tara:strand:- start:387 stop:1016 length:630 start_codon:yes stop_codon:yes gene_type:complete